MRIHIKRIYATPSTDDGARVLVDRLWPRGQSKEKLKIESWAKELAPSHELRKWFKHEPDKWQEFKRRYKKELDGNIESIELLLNDFGDRTITLLYSAKDEKYNQAVVLRDYMKAIIKRKTGVKNVSGNL